MAPAMYKSAPRAKVGIIVHSEICEELNKEEAVYLNDRKRPWVKNTPKRWVSFNERDNGTKRAATTGDVSLVMYLKDRFKDSLDVDIITPEQLSAARLKGNDINFLIVYDMLEAFHTDLPGKVKRVTRIMQQCDNMYPSRKVVDLINYKPKYYKYLQRKGIPVADFRVLYRKDWVGLSDQAKIRKIGGVLRSIRAWDHAFVTKPVLGQASIMVKKFDRPYSKEYIASYVNHTMKIYPGVIFQELMREFSTKNCAEFRVYFVGDKFQYSVITDDSGPRLDKAEGGKTETPGYAEAIRLARKTVRALPQSVVHGVRLPRLLTRIDVGVAVQRGTKTADDKRVLFVSEVEFVPSMYIEDTKKMPDVLLGDQIKVITDKLRVKAKVRSPR